MLSGLRVQGRKAVAATIQRKQGNLLLRYLNKLYDATIESLLSSRYGLS